MNGALRIVIMAFLLMLGCTSPEVTRTRGGGPGADVGNRQEIVRMHEGARPAFAEIRGIERSRYLRCGRCGGGWHAQCLSCSYCGMTDHEELISLVPEKSGANAVIDACKRCLGYVKTFTTLQGSPPAKVMVDDLASVDLDIAALEQGYRRPVGAGYSLDIKIVHQPSLSRRLLSWRT